MLDVRFLGVSTALLVGPRARPSSWVLPRAMPMHALSRTASAVSGSTEDADKTPKKQLPQSFLRAPVMGVMRAGSTEIEWHRQPQTTVAKHYVRYVGDWERLADDRDDRASDRSSSPNDRLKRGSSRTRDRNRDARERADRRPERPRSARSPAKKRATRPKSPAETNDKPNLLANRMQFVRSVVRDNRMKFVRSIVLDPSAPEESAQPEDFASEDLITSLRVRQARGQAATSHTPEVLEVVPIAAAEEPRSEGSMAAPAREHGAPAGAAAAPDQVVKLNLTASALAAVRPASAALNEPADHGSSERHHVDTEEKSRTEAARLLVEEENARLRKEVETLRMRVEKASIPAPGNGTSPRTRLASQEPPWTQADQYPSKEYSSVHARGETIEQYRQANPPYPYVASGASHAALAAYHTSMADGRSGRPGVSDARAKAIAAYENKSITDLHKPRERVLRPATGDPLAPPSRASFKGATPSSSPKAWGPRSSPNLSRNYRLTYPLEPRVKPALSPRPEPNLGPW